MPAELARIIGRLVMGQALPRAELAAWGIMAMRFYEMKEIPDTIPNMTAIRPINGGELPKL